MTAQLIIQREIAKDLKVCPAFQTEADLILELAKRITFLKNTLTQAGLKKYVLGISGGVDSLTTGLMAQKAIDELRQATNDDDYQFIAMRLPYKNQFDEQDATQSIQVIAPDIFETVNIAASVEGLVNSLDVLTKLSLESKDFLIGNIKARERMVAQYAVAGVYKALVLGTDHAAEAVMGFFTKFGDGAFDVAPLAGLVKNQVRAFARYLGAPENLVNKVATADLEDLKPGMPDEQAHGVSYSEIDAFLHCEPVSAEVFNKITKTYRLSMHKRKLPITP